MMPKVINLVVFNLFWFACILGAGNGMPWIGVVAVTLSAAGHLIYAKLIQPLLILYVATFFIGFAADTIVLTTGAISFPAHAQLGLPVPIWMTFMWLNFATSLNLSMSWIRGRYLIAALFGFFGGPGAYYTGMKLDAINLGDDLWRSLLIIGIQWAVAMPVLALIALRLTSSPSSDSSAPTDAQAT